MNKQWIMVGVLGLAILSVNGCSTSPEKSTEDEADSNAEVTDISVQAGGVEGDGAVTRGAIEPGAWTGSALEDPDSLLYTKTIYFAFDSSEIDPKYHEVIATHADYLAANPSAALRLEGNCDEQGSREYNIGLGERRAAAVKRLLEAGGASADQFTVISYGEERPAAVGQNDEAWALNRRVDLVY